MSLRNIVSALAVPVGAILAWAGLLHLANPFHFAESMARYRILPEWAIAAAVLALPALQVVLGLLLVTGPRTMTVCGLAAGLFLLFAAAQIKVLAAGEKISCGCFGMASHEVGWVTLLIPLAGLGICLLQLICPRSDVDGLPEGGREASAPARFSDGTPAAARSGLSLVELLVVIGVIVVLAGLTLPAVQHIRESGRRTDCLNNLRMLGLAGMNHESAHGSLPEPWFNDNLASGNYREDRGLFVLLLPWLEEQNRADLIREGIPFVSMANYSALMTCPAVLKCPTSGPLAILTDVGEGFNGPQVEGLNVPTCDYSGNFGYWQTPADGKKGMLKVMVRTRTTPGRSGDVLDGLSNTLYYWESAGDRLELSTGVSVDFNDAITGGFAIDSGDMGNSAGGHTRKTYLYSWAGLRLGTVAAHDDLGGQGSPWNGTAFNRVFNVTNDVSNPFSRHGRLCGGVFGDGSTRMLDAGMSPFVAVALATRAEGDDSGNLGE